MTDPTPKEVDYSKYCETCEHREVNEVEEPCNTCLEQFWNEGTDQPINYKEKDK